MGYGYRMGTFTLTVPISFNTTNTLIIPFLLGFSFTSMDHIIRMTPSPVKTYVDASNYDQQFLL